MASLGICAVGEDQADVQGRLGGVTEWIRSTRLVDLIRVNAEDLSANDEGDA